ncbi:AmpE protein [Fontimonas thermophila]|uniref:AmpE protein n=1 Tax=Fontimonas thermophila TaxID=1076937 RepID=A0A1I2J9F2_9GAMM|nr:regulatory signaling modulator protein AmpE [Fontimonas thermophila]SFF51405.1 AmpE protein [Fontimonas thermophila]
MTLIGILLALGLERMLGHLHGFRQPLLFLTAMRRLQAVLPAGLWRSPLLPLGVVALPTVAVGWAFGQIEGPIVDLILSAGVLLLCLGPRDLAADVHDWLRARADGDVVRAAQIARALQRGPEPDETHRSLTGALFIQSHEKLFGVLLWFFVFGPAGAVAYRLASRLPRYLAETVPESSALAVADALHAGLAWLPARITALLYGLAGSLDDALLAWRRLLRDPAHGWRAQTWAVLAEVATAALGVEESDGGVVVPASLDALLDEVLNMQRRALLILLAAFALFATGTLL